MAILDEFVTINVDGHFGVVEIWGTNEDDSKPFPLMVTKGNVI